MVESFSLNIQNMSDALIRLQERRKVLQENIDKEQKEKEYWSKRHDNGLKARVLIQSVSQKTQKNIEGRISNLVTLALEGVFEDDPSQFLCEFVTRRNKSEADLSIVKNEQKMRVMNSDGGGLLDICSLSSRLSFATFRPSRRILISDEPFRNLSASYQPAAARMLKSVCETKDKTDQAIIEQIILVTHIEGLIAEADNVIDIETEAIKQRKKVKKTMFKRE